MNQNSAPTPLPWIVATGFFMQTLDTTIVITAHVSIAAGFNESPLAMRSIVVAYTLTMALLTPGLQTASAHVTSTSLQFSSSSSDQFSVRAHIRWINWSLLACFMGIGGSMLLPIGRLAILRNMPGDQYVAALALVSVPGQAGPIVDPTLGG